MIEMLRNIREVSGKDAKLLISPILFSLLDALFNMSFLSIMILCILDLINGEFTEAKLRQYSITLVAIFLIRGFFFSYAYVKSQVNGSTIITNLRIRLAEHVRTLNLGYFGKNSIGKLTSSFTTDVADFEQILTHSLTDFVKAIAVSIISLVFALIIDFKFALLVGVVILLALPFMNISGKVGHSNSGPHRARINDVISRVVEYINGIKTFKLYNQTGTRFQRLDDSFNELRKSSIKVELSIMPSVMAFSSLISMIIPAALLWGTQLMISGDTSPERFIAVIMLSISVSNTMVGIGSLYPSMKFINKATDNIKAVFNEQPLPYLLGAELGEQYDIEFKKVDFHYTEKIKVLNRLSFTAEAKQTTALIGPSGSGKSTIISLISRFWDIDKGELLIGGRNTKDIDPDKLNEKISTVFQDVYLFNDTILNNLLVGNPKASFEEVISVCQAANCHDFIMKLPNAYETMVGEGGSTLSGGEKQRISIARAILKDAPIVLLDESTSSLDIDNELEINHALDVLMRDKTVIVIAHRLNTILNADKIIVLDNGSIREMGTHKELLLHRGWYAEMYDSQQKAKEWVV